MGNPTKYLHLLPTALLLLLCLAALGAAQNSDITNIELGSFSTPYKLNKEEMKFFKLNIKRGDFTGV